MDERNRLFKHVGASDEGVQCWNPYANHPVGDSPEMMPLDSSLFKDLHAGVHYHVTRTTLLDVNDPKEFSLATSTEVAQTYTYVFNPTLVGPNAGIPCSKKILQDYKKIISNCEEVCKARGVVVPGLRS